MFMIEWTEFHDVRILFFSKVGGSDFDLKKFSSDYVISESVYLKSDLFVTSLTLCCLACLVSSSLVRFRIVHTFKNVFLCIVFWERGSVSAGSVFKDGYGGDLFSNPK